VLAARIGRLSAMQSKAATVTEYLDSLPPDRRAALSAVRKVILKNLDPTYVEAMQYGMIGYAVPHSAYPAGYHCDPKQPLPFAGLASQKQYMSLYLMCEYSDAGEETWFRKAWAKTGKRLDMGKSCIRFKSLDDLPLNVIGEAIQRVPAKKYIAIYETARDAQATARKAVKPGKAGEAGNAKSGNPPKSKAMAAKSRAGTSRARA
jgi:hypothetical protein